MVRDTIKDSSYFEMYIQNTLIRKNKHIHKIENLENPQQGYINSAVTLDLFTRNLLIAEYSNGDSIEEIAKKYQESLNWFQLAYNSKSFYVQLLWMISLGVLLEINSQQFNKIVELVKKDNPDDYLIDFLLSNQVDLNIGHESFQFPIPYKSLQEVITLAKNNKKEDAVLRLKEYLATEWYKGHSDSGWYDNHKSKHGTYAGYWSFESGALVKILGLDDTTLKGQQYYPYDLVHWKD